MNFYTGLLIGLMGIRTLKSKKEKIDFNENFNIKSCVNGRLRAYSIELKKKDKSLRITDNLPKINGIKQVSVNNTTGSLLIIFDENKIDINILIPAIGRLLELDSNLNQKVALKKETELVYNSINYALAQKSNNIVDMESAVPVVFIALGLVQLYKSRSLGIPSTMTLFYWAYSLISTKG